MTYNFRTHIKGDTYLGTSFTVTVNDLPQDLTDYRIRMHLRRSATPTSPLVLAFDTEDGTIEITDAAAGEFIIKARVIDIPAYTYRHDIEFTNPDGVVRTWVSGTFPVEEEVTYG